MVIDGYVSFANKTNSYCSSYIQLSINGVGPSNRVLIYYGTGSLSTSGSNMPSLGAYEFIAEVVKTMEKRGSDTGSIKESTNPNEYPKDGKHTDGFWYTLIE